MFVRVIDVGADGARGRGHGHGHGHGGESRT